MLKLFEEWSLNRWLPVARVKNPPANSGAAGDTSSILKWGRSPGGGNGNSLLYSCLYNPMDRGAWWATVDQVTVRHDWATEHMQTRLLDTSSRPLGEMPACHRPLPRKLSFLQADTRRRKEQSCTCPVISPNLIHKMGWSENRTVIAGDQKPHCRQFDYM